AAGRRQISSIPEIVSLGDPQAWSPSERALMEGSGPPAERAARATRARTLQDREPIGEATERLYRLEFGRGTMTVPALSGLTVPVAREKVREQLRAAGDSFELQAFSEPVICRNGHTVEIHRIPDQWFLRYGLPDWKEKTVGRLAAMRILPRAYAEELPAIFRWYADRPCTRRGRWLGTPFPLDPSWIVEPIADSTFYPAYFIVRRFVTSGQLNPSQLTEAFFDRVFLGRGSGEPRVDAALQQEIREEFLYWYPLDVNVGGKEHKRVHFPVFLYTHADLLSPELQPKSIIVHWWLVGPGGEKVSKKDVGGKGGRIPLLADALDRYGADAIRLYYAQGASPFQDVEWDESRVEEGRARLEELEHLIREALAPGGGGPPELEAWLADGMHRLVGEARTALEAFEFREYAQLVYVAIPAQIRRFQARGGAPGALLQRVGDALLRLLGPVTPFLAEELGAGRFPSLVASAPFPESEEFGVSEVARAEEEALGLLEEDLKNVLRLAENRGERVEGLALFVAADWKSPVEAWVRETPKGRGSPVRLILDRAKAHPELAAFLPEIPTYVNRFHEEIRTAPAPVEGFRELDFWRQCSGYLSRRFGFGQVTVFPELEAGEADPSGRRSRARPGRPAFYLIGHRKG
ncbi:MAG TPA: class I tRNA ligase family protein, partial [Thermoplasmata archaeon]|nr:class I tRNA ligase family protein [Thermoplasmata archaeon]